MKSMTGVLTVVQEESFRLSDDSNHSHRFTLALDASLEAGQLRQLSRSGARVTVQYDDVPDEITHVARRVFAAGMPNAP
jgi:hypothetical protein